MRRPSTAREALRFSPLMEAGWAHASRIESIPFDSAGAKPFVFLSWRPIRTAGSGCVEVPTRRVSSLVRDRNLEQLPDCQQPDSCLPLPISTMSTEYMDCPRSRHYLPAVVHPTRNQILVTSFDKDSLSSNQQRMGACPKCHLAFIGSVEHVSLDAGSCLIRLRNSVRGDSS